MKFSVLKNKVLRRTYMSSGLPIFIDRLLSHHSFKTLNFKSIDLDVLRTPIRKSLSENDLNRLRERAQKVCSGNAYIFQEAPIRRSSGLYLKHTKTGRMENLRHWSRVRINNSGGNEDVKFIWELNRLGDLDTLLSCALLDKEFFYLKAAQNLVSQWCEENPFNQGLNWFSNMEVAIRLLRLILLRGILAAHGMETVKIDFTIYEHYRHVSYDWRFTQLSMMGGNHLIVELAAMALYEILSGDSSRAYKILQKEVDRQFLRDGGYFEGSIGYHIFVLNTLLFVQWVLGSAQISLPLSSDFLRRAVRFVEILKGPDGTVPGIGDWDDGYVFNPLPENPRSAILLLNFAQPVLGLFLAHKFLPINSWTLLSDSGIAVHRRKNGALMVFRAASVVHGHAHLDMLSLHYITSAGPCILDGGTYAYNHSESKRSFYRSPWAHSSLFFDKVLPLKPLRTFAWRGKLDCHLRTEANRAFGEYEVKKLGTLHREVEISEKGYIVRDTCPEGSTAQAQFIVPVAERENENMIIVKTKECQPLLTICSNDHHIPFTIQDIHISNSYGQTEKATAVRFPVRGRLVTRLKAVA
jgi:hypothetical protein